MNNPMFRDDLSTPVGMSADGQVKISFDST
jgi:hypothetical protein